MREKENTLSQYEKGCFGFLFVRKIVFQLCYNFQFLEEVFLLIRFFVRYIICNNNVSIEKDNATFSFHTHFLGCVKRKLLFDGKEVLLKIKIKE